VILSFGAAAGLNHARRGRAVLDRFFSYVDSSEASGWKRATAADDSSDRERSHVGALAGEFSALYSPIGASLDPAGEAIAGDAAAGVLFDPLGRQLMERLEFDLLFRWFVGIGIDDAAWVIRCFPRTANRLLEGDIAAKLLSAVLAQPSVKRLLSTDHFSSTAR